MEFDAPEFALCLLVVPLLAALLVHASKENARAVEVFTAGRLAPRLRMRRDRARRLASRLCVLGAFSALGIALMQPEWGESAENPQRRGRDIMVLLDVSQSMLAEDASPNRLSVARAAVTALVDAVALDAGHRIGLVAFSGRATLLSPLTLDYVFFRDRLRLAAPEAVRRPGTMIGNAIRQALHDFGGLVPEYSDIVLISDGEDHDSAPAEAAKMAANLGVSIHTVGIGDDEKGSPIPVDDGMPERRYLRYGEETVRSRVDASLLARLARMSDGTYLAGGEGAPDLAALFHRHIADKPKRDLGVATGDRPRHRFQWFLAAALLLLVVDRLISGRGWTRARRMGGAPAIAAIVGVVVLAGISGFRFVSTPESLVEEGNRRYAEGDYDGALDRYRRAAETMPDSPWVRFNLGGAHFKKYQYTEALEEYARALGSNEAELESRLAYNAGTVKYHQAVTAMVRFQDAVTPLREAIRLLRKSLALDPTQPDARFNLELALRLARELDRQLTTMVRNAEAENRTTSSGQGHVGDAQSPDGGARDRDIQKSPGEAEAGQQARQAPSMDSPGEQGARSDQAAAPRALTPQEAEALIDILRDRAQAVQAQREQWRRARLRESEVARAW